MNLKKIPGFSRDKRRFWLVTLAYTFSAGVYDVWSSLFDVNLKQYGVSEVIINYVNY